MSFYQMIYFSYNFDENDPWTYKRFFRVFIPFLHYSLIKTKKRHKFTIFKLPGQIKLLALFHLGLINLYDSKQ